ncbi:fibronectin/fibrinogen-binding protein [Soehngenia longivitae]|uniref:Rqc2 homolog RqcH n=1 Tax=Soehngenia longivitae TaxID=2562294 RepID=A0A4Z0D4Y3_9FIRM|nr:NFACT RNA binding domain-containing protein [Soehngenia longivitae]TFZ39564.1 fibronectin/fibrinogen-binding protein [Soehngenia longivitae]
MSYDGIVTKAVVSELNTLLKDGRIDKIYQPEKDEIIIQIYNNGVNYKLLISASSTYPRLYITNNAYENPVNAPAYCMLLRKNLQGLRISSIEQHLLDRVIIITVSGKDELGYQNYKQIVVEIMGKYSNIILLDKSSNKIIDSIKRVNSDMSRVREVLPGLIYVFPPTNNKLDPREININIFKELINSNNKNMRIDKFLYQNFLGLSPLISKEICTLANIIIDRTLLSLSNSEIITIYSAFEDVIKKVNDNEFTPTANIDNNGKINYFYAFPLRQFDVSNNKYFESMSNLLDFIYYKIDKDDRIKQKSSYIRKIIENRIEKSQHKLSKINEELIESAEREKYKIYADLLQANIHAIPKGASSIELSNFYDPEQNLLEIPLDVTLSPAANAQKYYKKYAKLKAASSILKKQIEETKNEIFYLESVLVSLDLVNDFYELDEIRSELIEHGYIKKPSGKKKMDTRKKTKPLHYLSSDGFDIYVGKNNLQNEYLTTKFAKKDDLWFHAKNIPGSHVILKSKNSEIPESTIYEAAYLAALFSKNNFETKVDVDYTKKVFVKKPKDTKYGFVNYDNFKTVVIDLNTFDSTRLRKID